MDLTTGIVQTLRTQDIYAGDSDHLTAAPSGDEFAFTNLVKPDLSTSTLHIVGRDGLTKESFTVTGTFSYEAKLSFDSNYILVRHGADFYDTPGEPSVYNRKGDLIKEYTGFADSAWLPDGRIVLTKDDSIYLASSDFGEPVLLKQFPGDHPSVVSPSPDGKFIAFMLGRTNLNFPAGSVNMINIDGSGLRQVAVADSGGVDGASWSPDGQYLVLRTPVIFDAGPSPIPFVSGCPRLVVIPSQSNTVINVSKESALIQTLYKREDDGRQRDVCASSLPQWRMTKTSLSADDGTPPQDIGVNAGLAGKIWAYGVPDYVFYDVMNGTLVNSFDNTSDLKAYPSFDASEIIGIHSGYKNNVVTISTLDGVTKNTFTKAGSFSGIARLSPDGKTIAAEWSDIDQGDPGAIRIINLFTRDGLILKRIPNNASESIWHPDGSLLMVVGTQIYRLPPDFSEPVLLASFLDVPQNLAIDATGTKLAFQIGGRIWTSNLDGTAMKQMTVSSTKDDNPVWSPDGKWIAFTHKHDTGSFTCDIVHAIPSDGERIFIGVNWLFNNDVTINYFDKGNLRPLCGLSQRLAWFN